MCRPQISGSSLQSEQQHAVLISFTAAVLYRHCTCYLFKGVWTNAQIETHCSFHSSCFTFATLRSCLLVVWLRFYLNKLDILFDRPNTSCTYFLVILSITSLDPHISQERSSCGNILLICRHEFLGWPWVWQFVLQHAARFLSRWRENVDFLFHMLQNDQLLQYLQPCSILALLVCQI